MQQATGLKIAKSHAAQAIVAGPDQAEGYAVRGNIRSRADWECARAPDLEKAVALNPGDGGTQHSYGSLLGLLGRFRDATAALASLHDDPRFKAMRRQINLPD